MLTSHHKLFADYFQFYLQDDDQLYGDLSAAWTSEACDRMLAVAPHVLGVGTVRNMTVPVSVVLHDSRPEIQADEWDHITTASLQIDTGRVVIAGCTDYYDDAARIEVASGIYEAIICYGRLDSLSTNGLDGDDRYEVHLSPGSEISPSIVKQRSKA